jgi:hypothetical protein
VRRGIYSPIPDVWALPDEAWDRRSPMAGVDLRLDEGLAWLGELAPHVPELAAFPPGEDRFSFDNDVYEPGEAGALYATVRHTSPSRVLELGSGQSSLVIARALARNAADGHRGTHVVCDPYPSPLLDSRPGAFEIDPTPAEQLDARRLAELGAGDVLFIDTSHTVKVGGDVTRIVLDYLPQLAPGVLVHFHDIFLPYEYPRSLVRDGGLFWQEQYLLQAFLAFNPRFEVVLALHALHREHSAQTARALPGVRTPAAFWIRSVAG